MIKNIIFDWSGVVKDCVEDHLFVVNHMFKELGAPEITMEELRANWVQPYMLFYNKYLPSLTLEEEKDAYKRAIAKAPKAKPYPGIVETIRSFKDKNISMAVVSSDFPETLFQEIEVFGLKGVFLDVVTNAHNKSDSLGEIIHKYNFIREETIFIGDSNHEIEAGKNQGIKTGAVTWGYSEKERLLSSKPDFLLSSLSDLEDLVK